MFRRALTALATVTALSACNPALPVVTEGGTTSAAAPMAPLGPSFSQDGSLRIGVFSKSATRIEVFVYAQATGADEVGRFPMTRDDSGRWSVTIGAPELPAGTIYYGFRAWGPNWPFAGSWTKGSSTGF